MTGDSILRAASEVEMLAIAITTKHLSKAEAVRLMSRELGQQNKPGEGTGLRFMIQAARTGGSR